MKKNNAYTLLLTLGLIPVLANADDLLDLSFEELLNVDISSASKHLHSVKVGLPIINSIR